MPEDDNTTIPRESGQSLIEYAGIILVATFLVVVAIAVLIIGLRIVGGNDKCFLKSESIECRDYKVQQCLALERYTLDQCVMLVGGAK